MKVGELAGGVLCGLTLAGDCVKRAISPSTGDGEIAREEVFCTS